MIQVYRLCSNKYRLTLLFSFKFGTMHPDSKLCRRERDRKVTAQPRQWISTRRVKATFLTCAYQRTVRY